jgi:hypothetical protein
MNQRGWRPAECAARPRRHWRRQEDSSPAGLAAASPQVQVQELNDVQNIVSGCAPSQSTKPGNGNDNNR